MLRKHSTNSRDGCYSSNRKEKANDNPTGTRAKKISTSCHFRLDCRHLASISLPLILIVSDLIRMMLKQFVNFFFFCGLSCCLYIILPMSFGHERTVYSALLYSSLYLLFNRREKSWNRGKRIDNSNRVRVRYVHGNL